MCLYAFGVDHIPDRFTLPEVKDRFRRVCTPSASTTSRTKPWPGKIWKPDWVQVSVRLRRRPHPGQVRDKFQSDKLAKVSVRLRRRPHPGPYLILGLLDLRVRRMIAHQPASLGVEPIAYPSQKIILAGHRCAHLRPSPVSRWPPLVPGVFVKWCGGGSNYGLPKRCVVVGGDMSRWWGIDGRRTRLEPPGRVAVSAHPSKEPRTLRLRRESMPPSPPARSRPTS